MTANAKKAKHDSPDVAAELLAEIRGRLSAMHRELDEITQLTERAFAPAAAEDAADAATVRRIRGMLDSGAEELIPAVVVERLDAGESPVRVFREWRGLTQGQLAAAVEVDQSFISKIEAGTKHPTAANLGRLARALKVDADLLLPDED